ncbi:MAG: tryptophan synthase subunit alpha, partial [Planctomycetes bacterium]|nr:tryptophan synthase subunit alpha [Planctomycetota bacterium]
MSRRIARRFKKLQEENKKAFIVYICAGDPDLDTTVDLVLAMDKAGVDIVELGIPYSDPMADGAANQAASERALANGATVRGILDAVRRIREKSSIPILFFTYVNPLVAYGIEHFAQDAHDAGV